VLLIQLGNEDNKKPPLKKLGLAGIRKEVPLVNLIGVGYEE
jgi:hypothetical protein